MNTLEHRARAAWFRRKESRESPAPRQIKTVKSSQGLTYVTITAMKKKTDPATRKVTREVFLMAVFRVRNDDMLKFLRRWPKELEESP